ncbi:MAG: class I SAM-dependent methyltransferase, partial [Candidatus Bathyarchaeota archaeon]|nr:class I SAM-dependent methyltransferase [Candidatus Bathyarchaeota archaeon]
DSSFSALKVAYAKLKRHEIGGSARIHLFRFVDKLPFKDESLDGVAAINLISYLPPSSVENLILEAKRVLRKGGKLLLVYVQQVTYSKGVDDYKHFIKTTPLKAITSTPFYLAVAIMNLPMRLKTNITSYPREYIENLMQKAGFKNIKTTPTYYGKTTLLTTGENLQSKTGQATKPP